MGFLIVMLMTIGIGVLIVGSSLPGITKNRDDEYLWRGISVSKLRWLAIYGVIAAVTFLGWPR